MDYSNLPKFAARFLKSFTVKPRPEAHMDMIIFLKCFWRALTCSTATDITTALFIRWYAHSISPIVSVRIFIISFCMNFVHRLSEKFLSLWISNFHSIFVIIRNRSAKLFSVISQPWRHPGAILCFHVIIDIFISILHKLTKFNSHKLQVISQHPDNPCPRARHDAHVRARQNLKMLKIQI